MTALNMTFDAGHINAALCAVSKEETRYYLKGVFIDARGFIAPDEDITDLIVDLLHLLDTYEGQASVSLVLDMAKSHYEEESEA